MISEPELLLAVRWLTYHLAGLPPGSHELDNQENFTLQPTPDRTAWRVARHYRAGYSEAGHCNLALEDHLLANEVGFYWQPLEEPGTGKSGCIVGDYEHAHWKPTAYSKEVRFASSKQPGFALDPILAFLMQYAKLREAQLVPGYPE